MEAINSYDGPGFVGMGSTRVQRRDGVKLTHRELMSKFVELGKQSLNSADFERTAHLPLGKGRLACDPETGEFDKDSPRNQYVPQDNGQQYPRAVHSTITEGEWSQVNTPQEREAMLATRKWADKPMERRKRFSLTPEDQMLNLKAQLEAERAGRLDLEKRIEAGVFGSDPNSAENATLMARELSQERQAREALEARVNALLTRLESSAPAEAEVVSTRGKR